MTWILSSVEAHFILNLRPYKIAKEMWDYLKRCIIKRTQLGDFNWNMRWLILHKGVSQLRNIFLVFKIFWTEYSNIIYAGISEEALFVVQKMHETNKRDQFLMKLRSKFEVTRSNLMNRNPVPTLDACLSELTLSRGTMHNNSSSYGTQNQY